MTDRKSGRKRTHVHARACTHTHQQNT